MLAFISRALWEEATFDVIVRIIVGTNYSRHVEGYLRFDDLLSGPVLKIKGKLDGCADVSPTAMIVFMRQQFLIFLWIQFRRCNLKL